MKSLCCRNAVAIKHGVQCSNTLIGFISRYGVSDQQQSDRKVLGELRWFFNWDVYTQPAYDTLRECMQHDDCTIAGNMIHYCMRE